MKIRTISKTGIFSRKQKLYAENSFYLAAINTKIAYLQFLPFILDVSSENYHQDELWINLFKH